MLYSNMSTDHLSKWQKGQPSPNPNGRPPKFITTLKKQGYFSGLQPISNSDIQENNITAV